MVRLNVIHGVGSASDLAIKKILSVTKALTTDQARQVITQAHAICELYDQGNTTLAAALTEMFSDGLVIARRSDNGSYEYRLTDKGMEQAADLVKSLARGKCH